MTNNAGLTWTYLGAPFFGGYGYLSKLYAINENQIWVLKSFHYSGFEGSMWYSSNGGVNWSQINTGLISDSLNQVTYTDMLINASGIGIAIGFIIHPDDNTLEGFIQRTSDTGMTWSTSTFENERFKNVLSINDNDWVVLGNSGL